MVTQDELEENYGGENQHKYEHDSYVNTCLCEETEWNEFIRSL